jgi:hypothetical protein
MRRPFPAIRRGSFGCLFTGRGMREKTVIPFRFSAE